MKKRADEKFNLLSKLGSYKIHLDIAPQINLQLWILLRHPRVYVFQISPQEASDYVLDIKFLTVNQLDYAVAILSLSQRQRRKIELGRQQLSYTKQAIKAIIKQITQISPQYINEEKYFKVQNRIALHEDHEVRTEKDIIRYLTQLCDKLRKKYKPLEDKRKVCLAIIYLVEYCIFESIFKGGQIDTLSTTQLLEIVKHQLNQLTSLHFFRDNTQPVNIDSFFQYYFHYIRLLMFIYYMFSLNIDDENPVKEPPVSLLQPLPYQKSGKGQGLNHLIRGFGLDKNEYNYHLVQVSHQPNGQIETCDVWDHSLRYKVYNYVSNLMYILEKKDGLLLERMNLYLLLDNSAQLYLFDLDKCLLQEPKRQKSEKDQPHYIEGMKPDVSLLPPTFIDKVKTIHELEEEADKRKRQLKLLALQPKQENFIIRNIKSIKLQQQDNNAYAKQQSQVDNQKPQSFFYIIFVTFYFAFSNHKYFKLIKLQNT